MLERVAHIPNSFGDYVCYRFLGTIDDFQVNVKRDTPVAELMRM